MEKELEVKVLNIDLKKVEDRVKKLGGSLIAKEKQTNILIDSIENPIKNRLDGYLRIRKTEDLISNKKYNTFTLKKQTKTEDMRISDEYNTLIENDEILLTILKELGYNNINYGYKQRTSYKLNKARIDFDTWDKDTYPEPYMEIEVPNLEVLNCTLEILGLSKDNVTTKSIKELQEDLK